jgi:hypothetical protein
VNDVRRKIIDAYQGQVIISDQLDVQEGRLIARAEIGPGTFREHVLMFGLPLEDGTRMEFLPAPEAFSVKRIVFCFSASCLAQDVQTIIESAPWQLEIACKAFDHGLILFLRCDWEVFNNPMRVCEFCDGVYVVTRDPKCPSCGASRFRRVLEDEKRGNPDGWSYVHDKDTVPTVLRSQLGFRVRLGNAWTPLEITRKVVMWCCLEGLHARGLI